MYRIPFSAFRHFLFLFAYLSLSLSLSLPFSTSPPPPISSILLLGLFGSLGFLYGIFAETCSTVLWPWTPRDNNGRRDFPT